MPLSGLGLLLWACGFLGHVLLLFVLFVRKRAREFPVFTALIAAGVLRTCLLALLRNRSSERTYLLAFVLTQVLLVGLQVAVVYEVASHVFRPLGRWAPDTRRGILILAMGSIAVAGALTALATPVQGSWRVTLLVRIDFFSSTLLSELFVGMVALSVTAGLPWRTHVARIAHGLGAYALVEVAVASAHTLVGASAVSAVNAAWTSARMVLYLLCLGYWTVTLWRQAPAMRELPPEVRKYLGTVQSRLAYDLFTLRSWNKP